MEALKEAVEFGDTAVDRAKREDGLWYCVNQRNLTIHSDYHDMSRLAATLTGRSVQGFSNFFSSVAIFYKDLIYKRMQQIFASKIPYPSL